MDDHQNILNITPAAFDSGVRQSAVPVVVAAFRGAEGICSARLALLEEAATLARRRVAFAQVDLTKHPAMAASLGISTTPSLLLYQAGEIAYQFAGQWSRRELSEILLRLGLSERPRKHEQGNI